MRAEQEQEITGGRWGRTEITEHDSEEKWEGDDGERRYRQHKTLESNHR